MSRDRCKHDRLGLPKRHLSESPLGLTARRLSESQPYWSLGTTEGSGVAATAGILDRAAVSSIVITAGERLLEWRYHRLGLPGHRFFLQYDSLGLVEHRF